MPIPGSSTSAATAAVLVPATAAPHRRRGVIPVVEAAAAAAAAASSSAAGAAASDGSARRRRHRDIDGRRADRELRRGRRDRRPPAAPSQSFVVRDGGHSRSIGLRLRALTPPGTEGWFYIKSFHHLKIIFGEHPGMMSASEGGSGSWKSRHGNEGCVNFIS